MNLKDNPNHGTSILGGMWGFHRSRKQNLANHISSLILDPEISKQFKQQNGKGLDQSFLSQYIYPLIKEKSMIHDSYFCQLYDTKNSKPFPSRRIGNCFVGGFTEFCKHNDTYYECPVECRPKEHTDWKTC